MPTRLNDFKTGRRIVIQQRLHERDLTGHILDSEVRKDWVHLMLPMEFEPKRKCVTVRLPSTGKRTWEDPRTKEGELLCPERIGPVELAALKRHLGSQYSIAGQLQQRPAPEAGGILKKAWFKIWPATEAPKIDFSVLSIDTALTAAKSSAFSAATTWGVFKDEKTGVPNVILLSMWRAKVEYPELRERLQRMSRDYLDDGPIPRQVTPEKRKKPDIILIENKASGITLIQDLLRAGIAAWRFDPDRYGDKIMRVRLVSHIAEAGRCHVPGQAPKFERPRPWAQEFVEQCGAFPNAASRDIVDTWSQCLHHLNSFGFIWHPSDERGDDAPKYQPPSTQEEVFY